MFSLMGYFCFCCSLTFFFIVIIYRSLWHRIFGHFALPSYHYPTSYLPIQPEMQCMQTNFFYECNCNTHTHIHKQFHIVHECTHARCHTNTDVYPFAMNRAYNFHRSVMAHIWCVSLCGTLNIRYYIADV